VQGDFRYVRQVMDNRDARFGGTSSLLVTTTQDGAASEEVEVAGVQLLSEQLQCLQIQEVLEEYSDLRAATALQCCTGLLAKHMGFPVTDLERLMPPLDGNGMSPEQVRPACGGQGWGSCRR
jgi:hypothetical protein